MAFKKNKEFKVPHTWAITPNQSDVDWQGRDKWSLKGFSCPHYEAKQQKKRLKSQPHF